MTRVLQATPENIAIAAKLLATGELVAFPTETIYGLGADATSEDAVSKIYALKQRPAHNPLIAHVSSVAMARELAIFDDRAASLAATLWPGPLTLVLRAKAGNGIAAKATAGLDTIALRMPAHPAAIGLIEALGRPIVAPSANPSGFLSPTTPQHVAEFLGAELPMVLASGGSAIGLESTILDLTVTPAVILRPGAIGIDELEPLIGPVVYADKNAAIKAPGQLKRHYATRTPLRLNAVDVKQGEAFLGFGKLNYVGVEGVGFVRDMDERLWRNLSPQSDLHEAATHLYAMLHELDQLGATCIAVSAIPPNGVGYALNDRLARAAVPKETA